MQSVTGNMDNKGMLLLDTDEDNVETSDTINTLNE
jgi:hypothetical protein